jgi:hypothetical protein
MICLDFLDRLFQSEPTVLYIILCVKAEVVQVTRGPKFAISLCSLLTLLHQVWSVLPVIGVHEKYTLFQVTEKVHRAVIKHFA